MQLFLIRGLVAIAWAAAFAAASDSLTTGVTIGAGVLLVLYPLIDVVASLIDARSQRGSARRLLRLDAAVSAIAAVALGVAAPGSVADVLAVFGVWAAISGAAQLVVALRRRAQLGNQWPIPDRWRRVHHRRRRLRDVRHAGQLIQGSVRPRPRLVRTCARGGRPACTDPLPTRCPDPV